MKSLAYLLFLLPFVPLSSSAQIISKDGVNLKEKQQKSAAYAFIAFNQTNSFRLLSENKEFITIPLGKSADETPLNVWSYGLGINAALARFLRFEGGISYLQTGEQYSFQEDMGGDSTFAYQNKYRYFAMPCQVKFEYGKKLRFSFGVGIMPQLFNAYRQDQQWTTYLGGKNDNTIKSNTTCNTFGLSLIGSTGLHYVSQKTWGIFIQMTYREQLTNTFTRYGDYVHKSKGLGYTIGISKNIE